MTRYRITITCRGVSAEQGASASACIVEEFTHRPWHTNVDCRWDGELLSLTADNDYDDHGRALLDEFHDAVVACVNVERDITFNIKSVDTQPS